jgi:Domain of unknown function (DUF4214)
LGGEGADTLAVGVVWRQAASAVHTDDSGEIQGTVSMTDSVDTYYGVETVDYADISMALDRHGAVGQLYRLYLAAFGREPDRVGLSNWAEAIEDGAVSMPQVAAHFAGTAEFAARYGATSSFGFVDALYQHVLGREPSSQEGPEVGYWMNAINVAGRGGVLLGFSESAEHQSRTKEGFGRGVWYVNEEAVDVLRVYMTLLDRQPDEGGLVGWTNAVREAGMSRADLVVQLMASPEGQARFGALSNRDFVDQLYRTSLDRNAGPDESAHWTWVLDAGLDSRAGVAHGFAGSAEMTAKIAPYVEYGALYA